MDFFDRYWNNCPWTLHKKPINFFLTTAKNSLLVIKSATRNISAQLCEFIPRNFLKLLAPVARMEGVPLIRKTIPSAQSAPKQVDQPYSTLEKVGS